MKASMVKPVVATFARRLVIKKLGALHANDRKTLLRVLREIVGE